MKDPWDFPSLTGDQLVHMQELDRTPAPYVPTETDNLGTKFERLRQERELLRDGINKLISDLDMARSIGDIYTYGAVQERLRALLNDRKAGQ